MFSYPLKVSQIILFALIIVLIFLFAITQKFYILDGFWRFVAFTTVALIGFTTLFFAIKPEKPFKLAAFISFYSGVFDIVIVIIFHILIKYDLPEYIDKSLYVFGNLVALPFLAAIGYHLLKKKEINS